MNVWNVVRRTYSTDRKHYSRTFYDFFHFRLFCIRVLFSRNRKIHLAIAVVRFTVFVFVCSMPPLPSSISVQHLFMIMNRTDPFCRKFETKNTWIFQSDEKQQRQTEWMKSKTTIGWMCGSRLLRNWRRHNWNILLSKCASAVSSLSSFCANLKREKRR